MASFWIAFKTACLASPAGQASTSDYSYRFALEGSSQASPASSAKFGYRARRLGLFSRNIKSKASGIPVGMGLGASLSR